jgi:hypothetical protein
MKVVASATVIVAVCLLAAFGSSRGMAVGSLQYPTANCGSSTATVTFSWQPVPEASEQWLDLSLFDSGFAPGSFIGMSVDPLASSYTWSGIIGGLPHFWRVNALTPSGWVTSDTGTFVPCGHPSLQTTAVNCGSNGNAGVDFRWSPISPGGSMQYLDLSLFDNGFAPGTFLGNGPLPGSQQSLSWSGITANLLHYFRINELTPAGWVSSATGTFLAECTPSGDVGAGLECGEERWPVKTMSDADAALVNLQPKSSSVSALRSLPKPASQPDNHRLAPTELMTFTVRATATIFKREDDRDIHLVIASPSNAAETMIVEFPDVDCEGANESLVLDQIAAARAQFTAVCGQPTTNPKSCNFEVDVTGVGFFDFLHGQTGVAPNGIELHPVLGITFFGAVAATPTTVTEGGGADTCATFTSLDVQNWCLNPGGDVLNCADFPSSSEATRFTQAVDPTDVNRLDIDADGVSCNGLPP